ncbi:glycosyltransferase 87 family protein [Microlunatus sp. Y2014]|uniref:glycosyltransferase 87 family protein n=1 Tax=Microlunatus sp. Y2014 TaxID=3418488 RepID=UPI003DA7567D
MAAPATAPATRWHTAREWGRLLALVPAPLVAAWYVAGGWWPWLPEMADLAVYRLAGEYLLTGRDFYALPGDLPFIYPPIAALLAIPLTLVPEPVVQLLWLLMDVVVLLIILHRLGLRGAPLTGVATAAILFVQPITFTVSLGQVGLLLCALVLVDVIRVGRSRVDGWLVGLASAIKLTPAINVVHLWLIGRRREAVVAVITFVVLGVVGLAVLPQRAITFWGGLVGGDTGLGDSIVYFDNQSIVGAWARILGPDAATIGLVPAAAAAVLGLVAGAMWAKRGEPVLALCLVAFGGLIASPVSWSHHYVWILPLAVVLVLRPDLPRPLRGLGWTLVLWVSAAPWRVLPSADMRELSYGPVENLVAATTVLLVLALLITAVVQARRLPVRTAAPVMGPNVMG